MSAKNTYFPNRLDTENKDRVMRNTTCEAFNMGMWLWFRENDSCLLPDPHIMPFYKKTAGNMGSIHYLPEESNEFYGHISRFTTIWSEVSKTRVLFLS